MGSRLYPYKGALDLLSLNAMAVGGTNAWTAQVRQIVREFGFIFETRRRTFCMSDAAVSRAFRNPPATQSKQSAAPECSNFCPSTLIICSIRFSRRKIMQQKFIM